MIKKADKKERNVKITLEYEGTDFYGWQIQKDHRTVQGELLHAVGTIFGNNTKVIGSGRTDAGVHANGQVANFKVRTSMPTDEIKNALNGNLPADITVTKAEFAPSRFHAQHDAKYKTYRYTILYREDRAAQYRNFCMIYPHNLNLARMRTEAKDLLGKKNFKSFTSADPALKGKNRVNYTRRIKKIDIKKRGDFIYIDITADGFLYRMVRNIVGTLLDVGSGRLPKGSIKEILKKKDRSEAGLTAKAKGLTLLEVKY